MLESFAYSLWLLATTYAMLRGGTRERQGALLLFCLWVIPLGMPVVGLDSRVDKIRYYALIDYAVLPGALLLALRSQRIWPLFFAAAQLVAVVGHVLKALYPQIPFLTYALIVNGPSYFQALALIFGTMTYRRQVWQNRQSLANR